MSKRRLTQHRLVEHDLARHVDWIAEERPATAVQFIEAVEGAFRRLREMPEVGAVQEFENPRLVGLRKWPVPRFERFLIFYRVGRSVDIFAVVDGVRDIPHLLGERAAGD